MHLDTFSRFNRYNAQQLVRIGVHVGHSESLSSLYSDWIVYGFRAGVSVIDVSKFMQMMRLGLLTISSVLSRGKPI